MQVRKPKIFKLVLGGVMVALGTILSMLKVYQLPYGGSITLCSMLPILLYAYKYGIKWGIGIGFVYSITQLILDTGVIKGFDLFSSCIIVILDFVIAFSALGISGILKKAIKNTIASFACGAALAMLLRLISHILSGVVFFGGYAEWYFSQEGMNMGEWVLGTFRGNTLMWIYSTVYNSSYMLPEIIITIIVGYVIIKTIGKQLLSEET